MPMRINVHAIAFRENLWLPMPVSNFHSSHSVTNQKMASLMDIFQEGQQWIFLKRGDCLLMLKGQ